MVTAKHPAPLAHAADALEEQRIDKWLWCARFFKTRSLASKFVAAGGIRLSRNTDTIRIEKPSVLVRPGDNLAFQIGERLFIVAILACAQRRGPATEARALYEDNSPPPEPRNIKAPGDFAREKGDGRPTKKDRRALDALKNSN